MAPNDSGVHGRVRLCRERAGEPAVATGRWSGAAVRARGAARRIVMPPVAAAFALVGSLCAVAGAAPSQAQAQAPTIYPDARQSDPVAMGWMVGSPPRPERVIRFEDGSFYRFPQLRWSFSNWRALRPTVAVTRGAGPTSRLPRSLRADLDDVLIPATGAGAPGRWRDSLDTNYTDGIVVLHRGRIVYERYLGVLSDATPHVAMSVTKSFFGLIAEMLIHERVLDESATVARYLPELRDSGFGDATVRQVLDMTTALKFSEVYTDPRAEIWDFARAAGLAPMPAGYSGARALTDFLPTIQKQGEHGEGFGYRSANTEVLVWILRRVTGRTAQSLLQERLWQPLGAEHDAYVQVDAAGNAVGAGGLSLTLRDLARFGELMRLGGRLHGRQIVPAEAVASIRGGASRERFAQGGYTTLPGWSYRSQWWIAHDDHGVFAARGVHGQAIYVDPRAQMVIARFGSHPLASNLYLDPQTLPAFRAMAAHLIAHPR
jgi:CubicO group peptidase (beta-lactamase class C family)